MQPASEPARLVWWPEEGRGFYPVSPATAPYDAAYFGKYQAYAATELGRRLTSWRVDMVARFWRETVVDVGIGCGAFVQARGLPTFGYDVNPAGVAWLAERNLFRDPYQGVEAVTCWDSLEHIREPEKLLAAVSHMAFVSLPIFAGAEHAVRSRHFRRDEHYWYFTRTGFVRWAAEQGFAVVEHSLMESLMGREDIETFVLRRV